MASHFRFAFFVVGILHWQLYFHYSPFMFRRWFAHALWFLISGRAWSWQVTDCPTSLDS